jgi:DNA-directed RNA polymerase specialized sigma24 family protein
VSVAGHNGSGRSCTLGQILGLIESGERDRAGGILLAEAVRLTRRRRYRRGCPGLQPEDLAQEAVLVALRNDFRALRRGRPRQHVRVWMSSVLGHLYRAGWSRAKAHEVVADSRATIEAHRPPPRPVSSERGWIEIDAALRSILTERELVVLERRRDNVPWRSVAEELRISVRTARGHLEAAVGKLRRVAAGGAGRAERPERAWACRLRALRPRPRLPARPGECHQEEAWRLLERYAEGATYREMAEDLGIPARTLSARVGRMKATARGVLRGNRDRPA